MAKKSPNIFLLMESTSTEREYNVIENSNKTISIDAILQTADEFNRNNRKYRSDVLKPALQTPEINELMNAKSWFGEFGHPLEKSLDRQITIDNKLISHRMDTLRFEGNDICSQVSSIPTFYGKQFRDLILDGVKTAFSLRALGNVTKLPNGKIEVIGPMKVVTYDCVILPSHKRAYQQDILSESVDGYALNESGIYVPETTNNIIMNESIMEPLNKNMIIDYVKESSKNINEATQQLEFMYNRMELTHNGRYVKLYSSETNDQLLIELDEYIVKDIDSYMTNLF